MKELTTLIILFIVNFSIGQKIESVSQFKKERIKKDGFTILNLIAWFYLRAVKFYRKKTFINNETIDIKF